MIISKQIEGFLTRSSWIRAMFEEGERLKKIHGADKVFDLTLGNPAVEPPAAFKEELKQLALNPIPGMHRYMNNAGYLETRQAVAEVISEDSGLAFSANNVVMTVGAGGALNVVLKTILDPGQEVIVLAPYFVEYDFYIGNHGGTIKVVQTKEDFQPDLDALASAITANTRAIIINSPNNPTGVVYHADALEELGILVQAKGTQYNSTIYVISDEPYAKITYDGIKVPSIFKYVDNSFVVTSHSKDLALPGERIGYIAFSPKISSPELMLGGLSFANRTLGFVNAPAILQRAVTKLQRETVDLTEYKEKRDILYDNLTAMGYQMVKPLGAFYLFPKSPIADDVAFIKEAAKENLLLVPGSGFGAPGYFRIAYCMEKEIIQNSLPAFRKLAEVYNLVAR